MRALPLDDSSSSSNTCRGCSGGIGTGRANRTPRRVGCLWHRSIVRRGERTIAARCAALGREGCAQRGDVTQVDDGVRLLATRRREASA